MKSIAQTLNKYFNISRNLLFALGKKKRNTTKTPTAVNTELAAWNSTVYMLHNVVMFCGTSGTDYAEVSSRFIL